MLPDVVNLWLFPRGDYPAWEELLIDGGTPPEVADYDGYLELVTAIQADLERQGLTVRRVRLAELDLPNTPDGRAAVIGLTDDDLPTARGKWRPAE